MILRTEAVGFGNRWEYCYK